jgi:hypothetical protein
MHGFRVGPACSRPARRQRFETAATLHNGEKKLVKGLDAVICFP